MEELFIRRIIPGEDMVDVRIKRLERILGDPRLPVVRFERYSVLLEKEKAKRKDRDEKKVKVPK